MRTPLAALFVALSLLASACSQEEQVAAASSPAPSEERSPSPSPEPEPDPCPLTGADAPEDVDLQRPVLAVKIDNASRARPQAGLESADVVYEELVEGGITRFLAIFHCRDAERLGPVRSGRMVDPDLLQQYAPVLFAYSGANDSVLGKVASTPGVVDLQHGKLGSAYFRQPGRPAPHNLFTSTEAIRGAAAAQSVQGDPRTGFVFDGDLLKTGEGDERSAEKAGRLVTRRDPGEHDEREVPVTDVTDDARGDGDRADPGDGPEPPDNPAGNAPPDDPAGGRVAFSYASGGVVVSYGYDPQELLYVRSVGGRPHSSEAREPLTAVNVLVLKVDVKPGLVISAGGATSPDIAVTGEGEAVVLRAGEAVRGRWRRSTPNSPFQVVDAGGDPIALAPGNMWINLVPSDQPVTVE